MVLSAVAFVRLQAAPSFLSGLLAGLAGGAACLTRITSLSFLLPAHIWCWGRSPERRRALVAAGIAGLLTAALVGPFLVSCALAYGDPFYSINAHTQFYRDRTAVNPLVPMSWTRYLWSSFHGGELLSTMAVGLTAYPFNNKWLPYKIWSSTAPTVLRALSLAGLVLFLGSRNGRLLLVILITALLPFAFTWKLSGGSEWRFTMYAYPFYLVAAAHAADRALGWAWGRWGRAGGRQFPPQADPARAPSSSTRPSSQHVRRAPASAPAPALTRVSGVG
jgi:hypothetical protein